MPLIPRKPNGKNAKDSSAEDWRDIFLSGARWHVEQRCEQVDTLIPLAAALLVASKRFVDFTSNSIQLDRTQWSMQARFFKIFEKGRLNTQQHRRAAEGYGMAVEHVLAMKSGGWQHVLRALVWLGQRCLGILNAQILQKMLARTGLSPKLRRDIQELLKTFNEPS